MKKIILLLFVLSLVSVSVFASSDQNLKVNLNLKDAVVNLFGITTAVDAPDVSSYEKAIKNIDLLVFNELEILFIQVF